MAKRIDKLLISRRSAGEQARHVLLVRFHWEVFAADTFRTLSLRLLGFAFDCNRLACYVSGEAEGGPEARSGRTNGGSEPMRGFTGARRGGKG